MYIKVCYSDVVCLHCNKTFTPNRKDKVYCSRNCKRRNSEKRNGRLPYFTLSWAARTKKDYCECCGFKAIHRCQLDLDHIDGNHDNNNENNLQTLCSNCHRLKTWMNKDWENKKDVPGI